VPLLPTTSQSIAYLRFPDDCDTLANVFPAPRNQCEAPLCSLGLVHVSRETESPMMFPELLNKVTLMEDQMRGLLFDIDQIWRALDRSVQVNGDQKVSDLYRRPVAKGE